MSGFIPPVVLWTFLTLGLPIPSPSHCPGVRPQVEMTFPSDGVSIQKACYPGFGICLIDTFSREKLLQEMVNKYQVSRHVLFGYVDSVRNYLTRDTVWQSATEYYVDTLQEESVWLSINGHLKDTLPSRQLFFKDNWQYIPEQPLATTYTGLIDTPFIAFFDSPDAIRQMHVGPVDGCFFEPTAYLIIGNRVHKKGIEGDRMPGVSVPIEAFLQAVGRSGVEVPQVRVKAIGVLRDIGRFRPFHGPGPLPGACRYDLKGRRRDIIPGPARTRPPWIREYP